MKLPDSLYDFLAAQTTLTLGTINSDGSPYLSDLFYAHDSALVFYFLSDPHTRHAQNLTRTPQVSVTVHQTVKDWQTIRGVQMIGEVRHINHVQERAHAFEIYIAKFPFVREWLASVDALEQKHPLFGVIELYKITPRWLRWIDNTQGFGHKEEFEFH
jgi:uncharacterized protein YhbP (UPF0306 family)